MGASQYRKQRALEREGGLTPKEKALQEEQKKAKSKRSLYIVIGVVAALVLALLVFVSTPAFSRLTAVRIGDTDYSIADARYAYNNSYQSFVSSYDEYLSMFLDTSKPLDEQDCAFAEGTWADYFMDNGLESLRQTTALYDDAVKNGAALDEDEKAAIDQNLSSLDFSASYYGYTPDGYVAAVYGEGNNVASLRRMLERTELAYKHSAQVEESFTYTDEELDTYYAEHSDEYDTVSYYAVTIDAAADEENGIDADSAMAAAKESAQAVVDGCDGTLETFMDTALAVTGQTASDYTSSFASLSELKDWYTAADRQPGDVTTLESESNVRVICFQGLEHNDYNTVSVRHILVKAVDENGDGVYSDEEKAAARTALEAIQAQWDGTEESFIELANANSEDGGSNTNGGLYENIYKGQMVPEFDAFCFEDHKPGDTALVYGESSSYAGYHLVYYVGANGDLYSRVLADQAMRSSDYSDWQNALLENYEITKTALFSFAKK